MLWCGREVAACSRSGGVVPFPNFGRAQQTQSCTRDKQNLAEQAGERIATTVHTPQHGTAHNTFRSNHNFAEQAGDRIATTIRTPQTSTAPNTFRAKQNIVEQAGDRVATTVRTPKTAPHTIPSDQSRTLRSGPANESQRQSALHKTSPHTRPSEPSRTARSRPANESQRQSALHKKITAHMTFRSKQNRSEQAGERFATTVRTPKKHHRTQYIPSQLGEVGTHEWLVISKLVSRLSTASSLAPSFELRSGTGGVTFLAPTY